MEEVLDGATWDIGDVNYDGTVTISDFIDLAANFAQNISGKSIHINHQDQALLNEFAASAGIPVPERSVTLAALAASLSQ